MPVAGPRALSFELPMLPVLVIRPESKIDRGFMYTHIDLMDDFSREV